MTKKTFIPSSMTIIIIVIILIFSLPTISDFLSVLVDTLLWVAIIGGVGFIGFSIYRFISKSEIIKTAIEQKVVGQSLRGERADNYLALPQYMPSSQQEELKNEVVFLKEEMTILKSEREEFVEKKLNALATQLQSKHPLKYIFPYRKVGYIFAL